MWTPVSLCLVHPSRTANAAQKFSVSPSSGWGFCSRDCFPDRRVPMAGVAKRKEVKVLDDRHCQRELTCEGKKVLAIAYRMLQRKESLEK